MQCDLEWRGLWHPVLPGRFRNELIGRAIIYLVTPIAIALLFGEIHSVDQFTRAYVGSFIVGSSVGGCFEVAYRVMWTRLITRRPSWPMRIAGHVITIPIAAGLGTLLANAVGNALLGWHENDFVRLYLQDIVISAVIITILVTADEANGRAREASRREALARMAAVHAELATLQARTDPHFLFNSLNTVAALIPEDPELAETLLLRLAAVFRYALDAGRKGSVALAEEIAAVTAYLEVEALRLGPRLSWRLDRDAGLDAVQVPPLVLQPLVENAIRHGAGARRGATAIVVSARRRDGDLVLAVEDQGEPGDTAPTPPGSGSALADLRARLALTFAERAQLAAGAAPPAGWRAEVVMPLERAG